MTEVTAFDVRMGYTYLNLRTRTFMIIKIDHPFSYVSEK